MQEKCNFFEWTGIFAAVVISNYIYILARSPHTASQKPAYCKQRALYSRLSAFHPPQLFVSLLQFVFRSIRSKNTDNYWKIPLLFLYYSFMISLLFFMWFLCYSYVIHMIFIWYKAITSLKPNQNEYIKNIQNDVKLHYAPLCTVLSINRARRGSTLSTLLKLRSPQSKISMKSGILGYFLRFENKNSGVFLEVKWVFRVLFFYIFFKIFGGFRKK